MKESAKVVNLFGSSKKPKLGFDKPKSAVGKVPDEDVLDQMFGAAPMERGKHASRGSRRG